MVNCTAGQSHLWNYISNWIAVHTLPSVQWSVLPIFICRYKVYECLCHVDLQLPWSQYTGMRSYITVATPLTTVPHFCFFRRPDMHGSGSRNWLLEGRHGKWFTALCSLCLDNNWTRPLAGHKPTTSHWHRNRHRVQGLVVNRYDILEPVSDWDWYIS